MTIAINNVEEGAMRHLERCLTGHTDPKIIIEGSGIVRSRITRPHVHKLTLEIGIQPEPEQRRVQHGIHLTRRKDRRGMLRWKSGRGRPTKRVNFV